MQFYGCQQPDEWKFTFSEYRELELCRRSRVNTVSQAVVGVVHVEQVDLLQDVVRVVQRPRRGGQAGELLYKPAVLPQQSPDLVLR